MTENKNAKTPADGPEYERGFVEGMQRQMQLHVNRVIKTWNERCEEHPDHQERIISERMIQARMQEEIDELRQALETKQEPFEYWSVAGGWVKLDEMREHFEIAGCGTIYKSGGEGRSPLYTAPPKQWVGLTDEEVNELVARFKRYSYVLLREVEAKLKEKNGG